MPTEVFIVLMPRVDHRSIQIEKTIERRRAFVALSATSRLSLARANVIRMMYSTVYMYIKISIIL